MLTPEPMVVYVNNTTTEAEESRDGSQAHPFKHFSEVVKAAYTRRFISDACCEVHLVSDYTFSSSISGFTNSVDFRHPDMTEQRSFKIIGDGTRRKIVIDYSNQPPYYSRAITCNCNCQFKDIVIEATGNYAGYTSIDSLMANTSVPERNNAIY